MGAHRPLLRSLRGLAEEAQAGGKGAAVARLAQAGLPVPPAWVLPRAVLDDHLARLGLTALAQQVEDAAPTASSLEVRPGADLPLPPGEGGGEGVCPQHGALSTQHSVLGEGAWQPAARRLRAAILQAPLPPALGEAVAGLLARLRAADRDATLAVRSSATCEGLPGASFAGQFQTFLNVHDAAQARAAIRSCWASLWSTAALSYRASLERGPAPGMAVLLQRFIRADAAGAAHVDEAGVSVESAWGLGASVMSGLVLPDRYDFDRDGQLLAARPGRKPTRADAGGGNLEWRSVPTEAQETFSLDVECAARVARQAMRAAATIGLPAEVEWAVADDTVWLLQARPAERRQVAASGAAVGAELRGIPAAPGEVEGPARVVRDPRDLDAVGPGDVVVAAYASAAVATCFQGAGLVTEMGGSSAHATSIAAERGLPMVAGVLGITRRVRDGQSIRVDGTRGTVRVSPWFEADPAG